MMNPQSSDGKAASCLSADDRGAGCVEHEVALTVAICTRNSVHRISRVLRALAAQDAPPQLGWEILLIDNASDDGTGELVRQYAREHLPGLRMLREEKLGLSHARQCAARAARGHRLGFVDDDNVVAADWVRECVAFMQAHPRAGLVGGKVIAAFEYPKTRPVDFDQHYAAALACCDLGDHPQRYAEPVHYPPCGAGLIVPTQVLRAVYEHCGSHLTGRRGGQLIAGEDYEIGLLILQLGWEAWYAPTLRMEHVMPPARLTEHYMKRLRVGNAQSEVWLQYLRGIVPPRGRWVYLGHWGLYTWRGWRLSLVARLRRQGHPDSQDYPYWAEKMRLYAAGAWMLLVHYPFSRVQRGLAHLRRDPALAPPAERMLSESGTPAHHEERT